MDKLRAVRAFTIQLNIQDRSFYDFDAIVFVFVAFLEGFVNTEYDLNMEGKSTLFQSKEPCLNPRIQFLASVTIVFYLMNK